MKTILTTVLSLLFLSVAAQETKIHSPAEIFKIMDASKISYEIAPMDIPILSDSDPENININNCYRVTTASGFSTKKYSLKATTQAIFDKGENEFSSHNYAEARKYYQQAFDADTNFFTALTYIGQTYGIEKNWDKAIETYQKVTSKNYIDYMAHWFLGDCYIEKGRNADAMKEIMIAHILNRNNPRIKEALFNIMETNKKKYDDSWQFTPQMELTKIDDKKVKVAYKGVWLGYALAKAVWQFEPGYKESMGITDTGTVFNSDSEKEALIALLTGADKKAKLSDDIKALKKAIDKKMFQEYSFYEILLPKHPWVAYQFSETLVNDMADYILAVRCK